LRGLIGFLIGFGAGLAGLRKLGSAPAATGRLDVPHAEVPLKDEIVLERLQAEWRRLGLLQPTVGASVIDGVVYLRGQARGSAADALVAIARPFPGVIQIKDEMTRS
jgi:hypothetical protein